MTGRIGDKLSVRMTILMRADSDVIMVLERRF
jgi:hypothetical protein